MEAIVQQGRQYFPSQRNNKQPQISLGMTTYLIMAVAAMHLTFGLFLTSQQFGDSHVCHGHHGSVDSICSAKMHYLPIGDKSYVDYITGKTTLQIAYYKATPFIFILIGKIVFA